MYVCHHIRNGGALERKENDCSRARSCLAFVRSLSAAAKNMRMTLSFCAYIIMFIIIMNTEPPPQPTLLCLTVRMFSASVSVRIITL